MNSCLILFNVLPPVTARSGKEKHSTAKFVQALDERHNQEPTLPSLPQVSSELEPAQNSQFLSFTARASLFLLCLALFLCPQSRLRAQSRITPAEAAAMQAAVREYVVAYNAMDPKRLADCFSAGSANSEGDVERNSRYFASAKKMEFREVSISKPKIDEKSGPDYEIELKAVHYSEDRNRAKPSQNPVDEIFEMVSEDSRWKISNHFPVAGRIASEILRQLTREDRTRTLRADKERLSLGVVHSILNRVDQSPTDDASRFHEIAMEVAVEMGSPYARATVEMDRGSYRSFHNNIGGAIDAFSEALKDYVAAKDVEGQAWANERIADQYEYARKWKEAEKSYSAAIELFRRAGDERSVLAERVSISVTQAAQGNSAAAEAGFAEEIRDAERLGEYLEENRALRERARFYFNSRRDEEALADLKRCISVSEKSGRPVNQVLAYASYARAVLEHEHFEDAIRISDEGTKFANDSKPQLSIAELQQIKGAALSALGKNEDAIRAFSEALVANDSAPSPLVAAEIHGHIADIYFRDLLHYSQEVNNELELAENAASQSGSMSTQIDIDIKRGQLTVRAITELEPILQSLANYPALSTDDLRRQAIEFKAKRKIDLREAVQRLNHAVGAAAGAKIPLLEARARSVRAELYSLIDPTDPAATDEAEAAIDAAKRTEDKTTQLLASESLARVLIANKKWGEAAVALRDSIRLIEDFRAGVRYRDDRSMFLAMNEWPFKALAQVLYETRDADGSARQEALNTSESLRARSLEDVFSKGNISAAPKMTEAERTLEELLAGRVTAAQLQLESVQQLGTASESIVREAVDFLQQCRADQDQFRSDVILNHSNGSSPKAEQGFVKQTLVDDGISSIEPGTSILEYLVTDDSILVFIFSRTPSEPGRRLFATVRVPALRLALLGQISQFRSDLQNPNSQYGQDSKDLYNLLIAPVEKYLVGQNHLVIVPDSDLALLPFQALHNGKEFLLQSFAVSYAPSIAVLGRTSQLAAERHKYWQALPHEKQNAMLAMGAPNYPPGFSDLKGARDEVAQVASLFNVRAFVGAEATRENALKSLPSARYVHFATHSRVDPFSSMRSAIVLTRTPTDTGFLETQDLLTQNLTAEMVVLSACNTGADQTISGEGLQGLSWALFMAGSPTNIVTQWEVSDSSTKSIMQDFYTRLLSTTSAGKPPGKLDALRAAQLKFISGDKRYSHPYYWGAFILTGAAN